MSDDERPLTDAPAESPLTGGAGAPTAPVTTPTLAEAAVESVLDLDEVMSQARLVEKKAHICLRGDLQAERDEILAELATLVDAEGRLLEDENEDQSLADESRAVGLMARLKEVDAAMAKAMRVVTFRALPEDEWRAWDKAQPRDADRNFKNPEQAHNDLVSKTAIAPTFTVAAFERLRTKLALPQITTLINAAFDACTTGGVDIPKSQPFLLAPKRDSSGRS